MATKKKKHPKAPKKSASLAVWENYHDRVKAVNKYNNELVSDKKKKENLQKKISGIKK